MDCTAGRDLSAPIERQTIESQKANKVPDGMDRQMKPNDPAESNVQNVRDLTLADFEASNWLHLIEQSPAKTCLHYYAIFTNHLREASQNADAPSSRVFGFLGEITLMMLDAHSSERPYVPGLQWSGKRSAIPDDLTPAQAILIRDLAATVSDPEMRARLYDLVWIVSRKYTAAEEAIKAYLESASVLEKEHWSDATCRIERALRLAIELQRSELIEQVTNRIEEILNRPGHERPLSLVSFLLELLVEGRRGEPRKYARLASECAETAEKCNDFETARSLWTISSKWLQFGDDETGSRNAQIAAAETYVKKADLLEKAGSPPNYMVINDVLERGIQAHRLIPGQRTRVNELRHRLLASQPKALDEMKRVRVGELDATNIVQQVVARVRGKSFPEALIGMASLARSPDVHKLREQSIENMKAAPLTSSLGMTVVGPNGQTVAKIPSALSQENKERERAIVHAMIWDIGFVRGITAIAIDAARNQINLEHPVLLRDWGPVVVNNPFVPPGREPIFAEGLHAGLRGNLLVAVHLLIPQVENSFREILTQHNVITSKLNQDGVQEEKHIQDLLYLDEFERLFGSDLTFDLRALLVNHGGPNLRHETAHGLRSYEEFNKPDALYFWCAVLRLCIPPLLQQSMTRATGTNVDPQDCT